MFLETFPPVGPIGMLGRCLRKLPSFPSQNILLSQRPEEDPHSPLGNLKFYHITRYLSLHNSPQATCTSCGHLVENSINFLYLESRILYLVECKVPSSVGPEYVLIDPTSLGMGVQKPPTDRHL